MFFFVQFSLARIKCLFILFVLSLNRKKGFSLTEYFLFRKVTRGKYHAIILSRTTAYQRDCGTIFFVDITVYFPLDYRFIIV